MINEQLLRSSTMAKLINSATFVETGRRTVHAYEYVDGTVEVTLRGKTKTVPATKISNGCIIARGLVGRYNTGTKVWPASISETIIGNGSVIETINFGRDDRNPKFQKVNCIYFAE